MRGGGRAAYVAAYDASSAVVRERAVEVDPWVANLADQRQLKVRFGSLYSALNGSYFSTRCSRALEPLQLALWPLFDSTLEIHALNPH
jgi:hypothetical protein